MLGDCEVQGRTRSPQSTPLSTSPRGQNNSSVLTRQQTASPHLQQARLRRQWWALAPTTSSRMFTIDLWPKIALTQRPSSPDDHKTSLGSRTCLAPQSTIQVPRRFHEASLGPRPCRRLAQQRNALWPSQCRFQAPGPTSLSATSVWRPISLCSGSAAIW